MFWRAVTSSIFIFLWLGLHNHQRLRLKLKSQFMLTWLFSLKNKQDLSRTLSSVFLNVCRLQSLCLFNLEGLTKLIVVCNDHTIFWWDRIGGQTMSLLNCSLQVADLSPIEHLWDVVEQEATNKCASTIICVATEVVVKAKRGSNPIATSNLDLMK